MQDALAAADYAVVVDAGDFGLGADVAVLGTEPTFTHGFSLR